MTQWASEVRVTRSKPKRILSLSTLDLHSSLLLQKCISSEFLICIVQTVYTTERLKKYSRVTGRPILNVWKVFKDIRTQDTGVRSDSPILETIFCLEKTKTDRRKDYR